MKAMPKGYNSKDCEVEFIKIEFHNQGDNRIISLETQKFFNEKSKAVEYNHFIWDNKHIINSYYPPRFEHPEIETMPFNEGDYLVLEYENPLIYKSEKFHENYTIVE
jgi:hypothetical protein